MRISTIAPNRRLKPSAEASCGHSFDASMLWPLLASALGFSLLFGAIVLMRMRAALARQKVEARLRRM